MSTNEHFLIKLFTRLRETKLLSHGYLFFGESRMSREDLGGKILRLLEFGDATSSASLLDSMVATEIDGRIGIDEARAIIRFLWQTPFSAPYRAVYINGESLTPEAQNALLKIVEEPPAHGAIIIGARSPESLLPPLSSRLEKFYLPTVSPDISAISSSPLAKKFLASEPKSRKELIKNLIAEESRESVADFVEALLFECRKDPLKHHLLMKELLNRWTKMSQFNTNNKLQLETLISL